MIFSPADIPVEVPSPLGEIVEHIRQMEPTGRNLSRAQIDSLTLMADKCAALTHAFFDQILQYEVKWRMSVFQGETEYDVAIENRIRSSLKFWADATQARLTYMDSLKPFGFNPASLETLRPRIAEVRQMLMPDGEFFEGERLDELTAQAFEEDERGKTVEFGAMGE